MVKITSSPSQGQACGMVMFRGQITKVECTIKLLSYYIRGGCVFWHQFFYVNCGGDGRGQSNRS